MTQDANPYDRNEQTRNQARPPLSAEVAIDRFETAVLAAAHQLRDEMASSALSSSAAQQGCPPDDRLEGCPPDDRLDEALRHLEEKAELVQQTWAVVGELLGPPDADDPMSDLPSFLRSKLQDGLGVASETREENDAAWQQIRRHYPRSERHKGWDLARFIRELAKRARPTGHDPDAPNWTDTAADLNDTCSIEYCRDRCCYYPEPSRLRIGYCAEHMWTHVDEHVSGQQLQDVIRSAALYVIDVGPCYLDDGDYEAADRCPPGECTYCDLARSLDTAVVRAVFTRAEQRANEEEATS